MMMAVNVKDAAKANAFVEEIAERFKVQRTLSPPNTSMLLVTIVGAMTAEQFALRWKEITRTDSVVHAYMGLMRVADVIQGTKTGQELSKASLI